MVSLRAFWGEKGQKWAIKGKMKQWEYGGVGVGKGNGTKNFVSNL